MHAGGVDRPIGALPQVHSGVYGAWLQDGRLVTVEKARGPYTGWLDLPGGSPEPGETAEQTLRRELDEECGVALVGIRSWHGAVFQVDRASDRTEIDFRHHARIAVVEVDDVVLPVRNVEDVARVVLLSPDAPVSVTPAVHVAWQLLGHLPPAT
ncbi:NUDIX domain-containing protein [Curtobacterium sp. VKM Ac-2922]|uniref:NUDIX domain-containing protein n=1 Tax=Curtobacterium sp. VKM Ac-2922 TaxID=2929475 RepID=UPI001FB4B84B|nr:NUDIX domain-containing protein [Curtobacterium sp. VKM Ac-2922]MCJ1713235.1 NUDIX domain-containing protein [Curtobacterium sp. VKM Ac-2922]